MRTRYRKTAAASAVALTVGALTALGASSASAADYKVTPNNLQGFVFAVADGGDTRSMGRYAFLPQGGLAISTLDYASPGSGQNKVAGYRYFASSARPKLAAIGEPSMTYTTDYGPAAGQQIVIDKDGDGDWDGILVGESVYGNDWWSSSTSLANDPASPLCPSGCGSTTSGTLGEWRAAFPDARVLGHGFSLGSGVFASGVVESLTFNGDTFTFGVDAPQAPPVVSQPSVQSATPVAPTYTEATCDNLAPRVSEADTDGVRYRTTGSEAPGGTVTTTATPESGYAFPAGSTTSWTHTFDAAPADAICNPAPPEAAPLIINSVLRASTDVVDRTVVLNMSVPALPDGAVAGKDAKYVVRVNGKKVAGGALTAGDSADWSRDFRDGKRFVVKLRSAGKLVSKTVLSR
jgi:hypothetical protein